MAENTLDRIFEETNFDVKVLESLIVFSTEKDGYETNVVRERILRSVTGGLIRYAGSDMRVHSYEEIGDLSDYGTYITRRFDMYSSSLKKLQPRLMDSFNRMFKKSASTDYTGTSEVYVGLYGLLPQFMRLSDRSTISLPERFVSEVEDSAKESFSGKELEQLREIGEKMRPFMKEDTDYVRSNYRW